MSVYYNYRDLDLGSCSTVIIGKNAYGVTSIQGGGLETIIKSNEQAGGPLNQYSTVGYTQAKAA